MVNWALIYAHYKEIQLIENLTTNHECLLPIYRGTSACTTPAQNATRGQKVWTVHFGQTSGRDFLGEPRNEISFTRLSLCFDRRFC